MSITPTSFHNASTFPTNESLVWAPAYVPFIDWTGGVEVASSWQTRISNTLSVAEQRRQLTDRPRRSQRINVKANSREHVFKLSTMMMRMAQQPFVIPFYPDRMRVTNAISTSGLTANISADELYHRYVTDQRVFLAELGTDRKISTWESLIVDTFTPGTSLTFASGTANSYSANSTFLYPMMECRATIDSELAVITDSFVEGALTAFERIGKMGIPAYSTPGSAPASFNTTSDGYPILDLTQMAWNLGNTFGANRVGGFSNSGVGEVFTPYGAYPLWTWNFAFRSLSRENAFKLIEFFDSRAGRCYPFLMLHPTYELADIQSIGASNIVAALNYPYNTHWSYRPRLYVELYDGTIQTRTITSTTGTTNITINVDSPWSPTFTESQIKRASFATIARFDTDEMVQLWQTDGVMDAVLPVQQLINEQDLTVSNLTIPTTTALTSTFDPSSCELGGDCDIEGGTENNAAAIGSPDDFVELKSYVLGGLWPNRFCWELWIYEGVTHNGTQYDVSGASNIYRMRTIGYDPPLRWPRTAYDAPLFTNYTFIGGGSGGTLNTRPYYFELDSSPALVIGAYEQIATSVNYTLTTTNLEEIYDVISTDYGVDTPASAASHTLILYVEREGLKHAAHNSGVYDEDYGRIKLYGAYVTCDP